MSTAVLILAGVCVGLALAVFILAVLTKPRHSPLGGMSRDPHRPSIHYHPFWGWMD